MFESSIGKTMLWLVVMTSLANEALGVLPDFGTCPPVTTVENFDVQRFLGKWYEAERYFSLMSVGTRCSTSNYTLTQDGALRVNESRISTISRTESSAIGHMAPIGKSTEPKYYVRFDTVGIPYTMSYWILGTDYDSYAVVWSCSNVGLFSLKSAWIMTRLRQPTVPVLESSYQILDKNHINRAYLFRTDQKNCPEVY